MADFVDVGGGFYAPNFYATDWEWRDPVADTWTQNGNGDAGDWLNRGSPGGWFLTDAARSRLGWDDWGSNYWANVNWEGGLNPHAYTISPNDDRFWEGRSYGDTGSAGTFNQARYDEELAALRANNPLLAGNFTALKKVGDKEGQRVRWEGLNAAPGTGIEGFETNSGAMNRKLLAGLALVGGAGLLGNTLMAGSIGGGTGAAAGGAAGASGGTLGAGGSSLLGELTAGGLAGGATGGGAFGGMTAGGTLGGLTGGASSLVPASLAGSLGPGFAAGLGGLGSLTPTASTLAAWDALAPSITGVSAATGSNPIWDAIKNGGSKLLENPSLLKGAATLVGGLLGSRGVESGANGGQTATQQPVPTMYGGNAAPPTFQTVGPTETERRMTQQYLPSLFNQGGASMPTGVDNLLGLLGRMGPTSGFVPPIRRGLFSVTRG